MNVREILGTFSLALGTIILFKLFWAGVGGGQQEGTFVAPTSQVAQAPLYLEVDFADKEKVVDPELVLIKTRHAELTFSSAGGTLSDFVYNRVSDHKDYTFRVLNEPDFVDREQRPFLVAFDEQTPFKYKMVDSTDQEVSATVTYESDASQAMIRKVFTVYKDRDQIDMELTIKPYKKVRPRLLWPSPLLKEVEEEALSAVVIDSKNKFQQVSDTSLKRNQGYLRPELFGSLDKYFAFVMIKDAQRFTKRAYYKSVDKRLISFLEGDEITEETTWNFSFYLGPKELSTMAPVDARLEKTLNYGMFSFLVKPLLSLLNFFASYTYNYGWAILILTLLLKVIFLPFTIRGERKMQSFKDSQKKFEYLQYKYKDNPEELERARIEHMRKNGGGMLAGCLPMLAQGPFFIALSSGLNNSIELYRAPFVLWIRDLSLPDPYYILPFILFCAMAFNAVSDKRSVRGVMGPLAMALVFGAFMSTMAAGLVLYIVTNMVLHVLQTKIQKAF